MLEYESKNTQLKAGKHGINPGDKKFLEIQFGKGEELLNMHDYKDQLEQRKRDRDVDLEKLEQMQPFKVICQACHKQMTKRIKSSSVQTCLTGMTESGRLRMLPYHNQTPIYMNPADYKLLEKVMLPSTKTKTATKSVQSYK